MQVMIRFLASSPGLPKDYTPFSLEDGASVTMLLRKIDKAGAAGAFPTKNSWSFLSEQVLVAAEGRMLQMNEILSNGQRISIISQLIGG